MRISDWSSDVCSSDLDMVDGRAGLDRLADPGVDQRRFPARVGADEQDRLRGLETRDGGVEAIGGGRRHVVERAVQIGRASCGERVCQYEKISVGAVTLKQK